MPDVKRFVDLPSEYRIALDRLIQNSRKNMHYLGVFTPQEFVDNVIAAEVGDFVQISAAGPTIQSVGVYRNAYAICVERYDTIEQRSIENFAFMHGNSVPMVGSLFMEDNAVATDIITINVWEKVAGTTTAGITNDFDASVNNRLEYLLPIPSVALIQVGFSAIKAIADFRDYEFAVCKNGSIQIMAKTIVNVTDTRPENISLEVIDPVMSPNDFYELFVRNVSNDEDITITNLNFIVQVLH